MSGPLDEQGGDLLDHALSDFDDEDVDVGAEAPTGDELTDTELDAVKASQAEPGTPPADDPEVS